MEEVRKPIDTLVKNVLPPKAHYLSLDTTRRYRPHADDKRLEEQDIRPLQYTTFVSDAERGVLLTRAYFDVREEPLNPVSARGDITPRTSDPSKPKTKLSLKDYKNRKRSPDGGETPKPTAQLPKTNAPPKKKLDPAGKETEDHRVINKEPPDANSSMRPEARHPRSPSPDRKRRAVEAEHESKPIKRSKVESSTPNSISSRSFKDSITQKPERQAASEKKLKELKSTPTINAKPAPNSTGNKGVSPRPPSSQVNGTQKVVKNRDGSDKKIESNSTSKAPYVPPLLSPIDISDYMDDSKPSRPSPKKKPTDSNGLKPPAKKNREDREPSPSPKKRKIPPLLSPTLPPVVLEELAKAKSASSKDSSQKSSQTISDSPNGQKKAAKVPKREETIHVESGKGQRESLMVSLKYKKRNAKTIERLLNLPSGGKRKSDLLRRDERVNRDRSDSLEPGTARKRPAADPPNEAIKRPKAVENPRPSTPPGRSSAMTRAASNSSQVGTPGVANGLTPAALPPDRRRPPVDPEKLQRLQSRALNFIRLGTQLKHERDAVLKNPGEGVTERDRQVAIAAGIQCLVSFLLGFKLQSDVSDLERKRASTRSMRELLLLFRVTRSDCARHNALTALILRLQGICLVYIGRIMWSYPSDAELASQIVANCKEQQEIWHQADSARRAMGVYDGSSKSDDGGSIGKLIDRLGPWTIPEEAIPVTLDVLRKVMQANGPWKPAESLTKLGLSTTNGIST
ncbi:uncharacterized protein F4812DRAFT_198051 [Daldinia caldariorum]|uniref:uncharacterized protein n=1 Tax=Daldinia caldariorum TaxID=326644 RepID=UPI0020083EC1|nr:uncharacterized protein F4812DRAFT_198051 [Daldinia caldariorum]KAI1471895.1 hypothetical protein F4812DRAFT_198051 [Daldinia caldariorum]